jgi:hypothetical protein
MKNKVYVIVFIFFVAFIIIRMRKELIEKKKKINK